MLYRTQAQPRNIFVHMQGPRGPGPPFSGFFFIDYIGNHSSMTRARPLLVSQWASLVRISGSTTDMCITMVPYS